MSGFVIGRRWGRGVIGRQLAFLLASVVLAGTAVVGCDNSSTKDLTRSSARRLIQNKLTAKYFPVDISGALSIPQPSRIDYRSFDGQGSGLLLRRLLDLGIVEEQVSMASYPDLSGTFKGDLPDPVKSQCKLTNEYHLTMEDGSNTFIGTSQMSNTCQSGHPASAQQLSGSIDDSGKVRITFDSGWVEEGSFVVQGSSALLTMPGPWYEGPEWHMMGAADLEKVKVKWYSFSLAPHEGKSVEVVGSRAEVDAGSYKVGDVSNLQLASDTDAVAQFNWTASLNSIGRRLLGGDTPHGVGDVEFGKRPDGSWFISSWSTR